jgi:hypothetical protein
MSPEEIISEITKLSHADRREILRRILEVEEDVQAHSTGDQLALEQPLMRNFVESEPD